MAKTIAWSILAGLFLGFFFKLVEICSSIKVYTLLLNIDYVPILKSWRLPEFAEFGIHLGISIILGLVIFEFLQHKNWTSSRKFWFTVFVSLFIGIVLFPTTVLSDKTPDLFDARAFLVWVVGHGIYGCILGGWLQKS